MGRATRCDHDIDLGQYRGEPRVLHGLSAEDRSHFLRAFPRTVGDQNALRARAVQMPRGELAHFARTDDHHRVALQRTENLAR